jgi:hypothetical protein
VEDRPGAGACKGFSSVVGRRNKIVIASGP